MVHQKFKRMKGGIFVGKSKLRASERKQKKKGRGMEREGKDFYLHKKPYKIFVKLRVQRIPLTFLPPSPPACFLYFFFCLLT